MATQEFFKYLGLFGSAIGVAAFMIQWLSKKIFENYLQRSIEKYKVDLEKVALINQIKYSSLHTERALIIKELYWSLHDYQVSILQFLQGNLNVEMPIKHLRIMLDDWTKAVLIFSPTLHKNKILFSRNLFDLLNGINNDMDLINREVGHFLSSYPDATNQVKSIQSDSLEFRNLKLKCNAILATKISDSLERLDSEFRKLLGVDIDL